MAKVDLDKTPFCACSTPAGKAGIAVIRVSGDSLADYVEPAIRIIRSADDSIKKYSDLRGYTAAYADFIDPDTGKSIDKIIITRFVAPHSYTGDEMLEISCHGGNAVKQEILRILNKLGIRFADRGEFTKTAFINGKLDLTEAEAVMNVINSDSRRTLDASNTQLCGALNKKLGIVEEELYKALALIEMMVEFPEHDDTPDNSERIMNMISSSEEVLRKLSKSYDCGRLLVERMKIAICGLPNSGKSTLLNYYAGFERAIVTDTPGTTRDTLELEIDIDGIPVTMVDTAGIRETDDKIEAIGVTRAINAAAEADMILYVASPDMTPDSLCEALKEFSPDKVQVIISKQDLGMEVNLDLIKEKVKSLGISSDVVTVSAIKDMNMDILTGIITDYFESLGGTISEEVIILSRRHGDLLDMAANKLREALDAVATGFGVEIASSVIRSALDDIGDVTGKTVSSELVDMIFSEFCIGK